MLIADPVSQARELRNKKLSLAAIAAEMSATVPMVEKWLAIAELRAEGCSEESIRAVFGELL